MIKITSQFKEKLQKDNPSIYPIVIIDPDNNPVRISMKAVTVKDTNEDESDEHFYSPILQDVKALRETIDTSNYRLKLYSISLHINDREYNGEKFSTSVTAHSGNIDLSFQEILQNRKVYVYYTVDGLTHEDSAQVFSGICQKFSQKETTIQIVVESNIKSKVDLTYPNNLIYNQESLYSKYQGRYWPFGTFNGYKQESELIFYNSLIDGEGGFNLLDYVNYDHLVTENVPKGQYLP